MFKTYISSYSKLHASWPPWRYDQTLYLNNILVNVFVSYYGSQILTSGQEFTILIMTSHWFSTSNCWYKLFYSALGSVVGTTTWFFCGCWGWGLWRGTLKMNNLVWYELKIKTLHSKDENEYFATQNVWIKCVQLLCFAASKIKRRWIKNSCINHFIAMYT